MSASLALYVPSASFETVKNPFGKDTANLGLFQALALHGGFDDVFVLSPQPPSEADLARGLLRGGTSPTRLHGGSLYDLQPAVQAGSLLRGKADLADLAWLRRAVSDRAYSLIGLVHTIAPPAIREHIAGSSLAPIQPWDALICTSPAVRDSLTGMFDAWGDYLADRFGGQGRPRPQLPLVPLGVDAPALATQADRGDRRAALRDRLGLGPDDVLVLWLGRLSFFEKAFPQPMFRAVEEACALSGKRLCFAMGGWFPNGELGRSLYEEAARAYCPSVPLFILEGNDRDEIERMWAGADIFLSLVDNIQETFGLTPLEAMAAGLPVVASDWDGYRFTMQDGKEAFLVRTLGAPPGDAGRSMSASHVLGLESYQAYVGTVAQHTAVDVGQAAVALARLAQDPDLRRRMGRAGQERVRTQFDWPVVAAQIRGLVEDLGRERATALAYGTRAGVTSNPVKGDPFADFAGFATAVLSPSTRIGLRPGVTEQQARTELQRCASVRLDGFADHWRINPAECRAVLDHLAANGAQAFSEIQSRVPPARREAVALTLVWMCKLGILAWDVP
ncbi:glycosyltransferase family 4 protein [Methylobacterium sp. WL116]|uniref:glycosyltransferase family 4 protein n=1 Tax=Methylobacterium sp. WL116 TaxID=2603889 RepID=UPI0011C9D052|nr:glycosyltransferase family 4 protein [Methylobacterium sp. WL116]TXM94263.1 glycosyltransferase family 4 protein [Methylobacterium sp. WL116]